MLMSREEWQKLTPEQKKLFRKCYKRLYSRFNGDLEEIDANIDEEFQRELVRPMTFSKRQEIERQTEDSEQLSDAEEAKMNSVFEVTLGEQAIKVEPKGKPYLGHRMFDRNYMRLKDPDDNQEVRRDVMRQRPPDASFEYENGEFSQEPSSAKQGFYIDELGKSRCPNCYSELVYGECPVCSNTQKSREDSGWTW